MSINPFDVGNGSILVLINDAERHSLWPTFVDVPAGWTAVFGEADRAACLDYIERNWLDIRPKSLRDRLEQSPGFARQRTRRRAGVGPASLRELEGWWSFAPVSMTRRALCG